MTTGTKDNGKYLQALPISTRLKEDYLIESVLGQGGFGITYLAMDTKLNKNVAIKEFFPSAVTVRKENNEVQCKSSELNKSYKWALKKFIDESQTLAKFHHENIVRVYRIFEENNTAYIVLEYVDGMDMEQWLAAKEEPPRQNELDKILEKLLGALSTIHEHNVLHRDIKPGNIFIRLDGSPVLLDFGAAKYSDMDENITTVPIVSRGFSPYECYVPEKNEQGSWTDIYSLSATIYFALTGKCPPDALSRFYSRPDTYKPLSYQKYLNSKYRNDFLTKVDNGLRNLPKDRPQSIEEWGLLTKRDSGKSNHVSISGNKTQHRNRGRAPVAALLAVAACMTLFSLFIINKKFNFSPNPEEITKTNKVIQKENPQINNKTLVEKTELQQKKPKVVAKQEKIQKLIPPFKPINTIVKTEQKKLPEPPQELVPDYAIAKNKITSQKDSSVIENNNSLSLTKEQKGNKWDGEWILASKATDGCWFQSGQAQITIRSGKFHFGIDRTGSISRNGNIKVSGSCSSGNCQIFYKGRIQGNTGKGIYETDRGSCHGTFILKRRQGKNIGQNTITKSVKVVRVTTQKNNITNRHAWDGKWLMQSITSGDTCSYPSNTDVITIKNGRMTSQQFLSGRVNERGRFYSTMPCNSGACDYQYKGQLSSNSGKGTYISSHDVCSGHVTLTKLS